MDKLLPIIFTEYQNLLKKLNKAGRFSRLLWGNPPTFLTVYQKTYGSADFIALSENIIRKWKITEDNVKEIPLDDKTEDLDTSPARGIYFKNGGSGQFWISDDSTLVHLGFTLGGMNGQGWDYKVTDKDGKTDLIRQKKIWQA